MDAGQNASSIGLEKCNFGAPVLFPGNAKARPVGWGSLAPLVESPPRLRRTGYARRQGFPFFFRGSPLPLEILGVRPLWGLTPYGEAGKASPRKTGSVLLCFSGWIYGIHRALTSTKLWGFEVQGFGAPAGQSS